MAKRYGPDGKEIDEAFTDSTLGKATLVAAGTVGGTALGVLGAKWAASRAAKEGTKAFRGGGTGFKIRR